MKDFYHQEYDEFDKSLSFLLFLNKRNDTKSFFFVFIFEKKKCHKIF